MVSLPKHWLHPAEIFFHRNRFRVDVPYRQTVPTKGSTYSTGPNAGDGHSDTSVLVCSNDRLRVSGFMYLEMSCLDHLNKFIFP